MRTWDKLEARDVQMVDNPKVTVSQTPMHQQDIYHFRGIENTVILTHIHQSFSLTQHRLIMCKKEYTVHGQNLFSSDRAF